MKPGDRLVCVLIEPLKAGQTFKDWPLHITIVPWFRLTLSVGRLARELQASYIGSQVFALDVKGRAQFGYKQHKTVNLVAAPLLERLEDQTRRLLHAQAAWIVDEADKTRRGYRPHITHQPTTDPPHEGDSWRVDQVFIVEQRGDYKQVVAVVELGHEAKT